MCGSLYGYKYENIFWFILEFVYLYASMLNSPIAPRNTQQVVYACTSTPGKGASLWMHGEGQGHL
jgi:hypothetical protein